MASALSGCVADQMIEKRVCASQVQTRITANARLSKAQAMSDPTEKQAAIDTANALLDTIQGLPRGRHRSGPTRWLNKAGYRLGSTSFTVSNPYNPLGVLTCTRDSRPEAFPRCSEGLWGPAGHPAGLFCRGACRPNRSKMSRWTSASGALADSPLPVSALPIAYGRHRVESCLSAFRSRAIGSGTMSARL